MQTSKRQDGDCCDSFKKITTSEGKALFLELLVLVSREVKEETQTKSLLAKNVNTCVGQVPPDWKIASGACIWDMKNKSQLNKLKPCYWNWIHTKGYEH